MDTTKRTAITTVRCHPTRGIQFWSPTGRWVDEGGKCQAPCSEDTVLSYEDTQHEPEQD